MSTICRRSLGLLPLILLVPLSLAACAPTTLEPAAQVTAEATTAPALAAYPVATETLSPYPWPTASPGPTEPPEPTEVPTETPPLMPTLPPTPVVTPIPTAAPPFIPFPEGTTPQPFTLYWRDGDIIRTLRTDESEPRVFLDPVAEFGLFLPPMESGIHTWGAVSPEGGTLALVLAEALLPAFVEDAPYPVHLYLFSRETRELRLLVKNALEPVWSPDGKRLAYRSTETGGLWVAEVESGMTAEVYKVDRANEHVATDFTWSPDGRRLALIDEVFRQSRDLLVVDSQGEEPPRVLISSPTHWIYAPQWSPTSDQIAFVWLGDEGAEFWHLWVINPDGTGQLQLTHDIDVLAGGGAAFWSPDGQWVAFGGAAVYEGPFSQIDLWLINPNSGDLRRLTYEVENETNESANNQTAPQWSPDGTQLVFHRGSPGVWTLSLISGRANWLFTGENTYRVGLTISR